MRNLTKLLVVVLALTMTTELFAQNFGIKGGLNLSNMRVKDDNKTYSDDYRIKPGFHIGATAEFPLAEMLSFETGLLLSTKGFTASKATFIYGGGTLKSTLRTNLLYLDIPLTVKGSSDLGRAKSYGVFGPYLGFGLSGKTKYKKTSNYTTSSYTKDIEWGSDKDKSDLKRLDFGLTMGTGVEINSIQIGLSFNLGLANISPNTDGGAKINNRVFRVSIGYIFGEK